MLLTAAEQNFLGQYAHKLPGIVTHFEEAVAIPAANRPAWAKNRLKSVYRDGWQSGKEFGWHDAVPLDIAETTAQHVTDLTALAREYFSGTEGDEIVASIDVHDDLEAVAHIKLPIGGVDLRRDINLFRGIILGPDVVGVVPKDVKAQIEEIGARVIFEADSERKERWFDYEHKGSEAAKIASSLDKVAVMVKCMEYLDLGMTVQDFRAYWSHWTPERMAGECHPRVSQLYGDTIWPQIQDCISLANAEL